jgi:putative ABC transport system permease protein
MSSRHALRGVWVAWRALTRAQLQQQPLPMLATVLAIALGVALGSAVYLVNGAALNEFDAATRRLIGDADILVRAGAQGFDESLFVALAHDPKVSAASPVLELTLTLPVPGPGLRLLALDPFRAAALQPLLMAELGADVTRLFEPDSVVLSRAAAQQLGLQRGSTLPVIVGGSARTLHVIDVLSDQVYPEPLAIMDIGTAQWSLQRLGRLTRIDLRLRPGVDANAFRSALARRLPPGVVTQTPAIERARAVTATRAYRVNLNMLALVSLLTGAFLVFSTQSLAVLRRRTALGLLRALGLTRAQLRGALLAEGAAIGAAGSMLGAGLGALIALLVLRYLGTDLGNRELAGIGAVLALPVMPMLAFIAIGTAVACLGAWFPATEAAARPPALAMKAGDAEPALGRRSLTLPALLLLLAGALLPWLPPVRGVPWAGYTAIALLLAGAVLLIPALMQRATGSLPRSGYVTLDMAVAQLQGSAALSSISLAAIIVSFSLMVAMAIMVHSFRDSFDLWLLKLLPSDLQMRIGSDSDTGRLSLQQQQRIARLPGVARAEFRRVQPIWLRSDRAPVTLIAREITAATAADVLPVLRSAPSPRRGADPAWISEALSDLYGLHPGDALSLPLGASAHAFYVAGVFRDYVRPGGAIEIARSTYVALTGDSSVNEGSVWQRPFARNLEQQIRDTLMLGDALELISTPQLRVRSLQLFDRAFAITYALEGLAVGIGLVGVAVAASSTALARRAQFGMLRHIGMQRSQVLAMLASEGVITSALAVAYGLLLGGALSVILVYVINRQSFHWSIDLSLPWRELGSLSAALIAASALTALWSGRAAMSQDALRAVREDW